MSHINRNSKIYIAGHNGMVGSSIVRVLEKNGYSNLLEIDRSELDLMNQKEVKDFLKNEKPDLVIIAAAKVGGILANNQYKAEFLHDNLQIQNNLIDGAHLADVDDLVFLGSSCIYPKFCQQPIKEEFLLTGELEPTNEPYAIAKIAGLKMCQFYKEQYSRNYFSVMPCNLYGTNDNYDLENSHVLPALLRKIHEAKLNDSEKVEIWGTGNPRREFLHVDDLAKAILFLIENKFEGNLINIGSGKDITIKELANLIIDIIGFSGFLNFDSSKPDGTPKKLLDVSKIKSLGWSPEICLEDGLKTTYLDEFK
jgi:GDP-L-fucose synthase